MPTCARDSFTFTYIVALSLYLWFPTFFKYEDPYLTSIIFTDPQTPIFVVSRSGPLGPKIAAVRDLDI
jgi:hypothetical protein